MALYCEKNRLPLRRSGKVILPVQKEQDSQIETLLERARANGARAFLIEEEEVTGRRSA